MKAIVCRKSGSPEVLEIKDIDIPVPGDNEILIKNIAGSVTAGDCRIRGSAVFITIFRLTNFFKRKKHLILGIEFSGEIEAIGKNVTKFAKGDRVYGSSGMRLGCYAEYLTVSEDDAVVPKPEELSSVEAAALPVGASTALYFLKEIGKLQPGEKVLIYGASGSVGSYAIQVAKHLGAEVTGVCSTANIDLVKSLGADKVLDYKDEDFGNQKLEFDLIFETVGKLSPQLKKNWLKEAGRFVTTQGLKVAPDRKEDLQELNELIKSGAVKPIIDKTFSLDQIVEAHTYVSSGRKKGNVVIEIS